MSWLLQKPTDLDLHCLQRQGISGFSRTRVKSILLPVAVFKIAGRVAENSKDPDQTTHSTAFDLGLHCMLRFVCPSTYVK